MQPSCWVVYISGCGNTNIYIFFYGFNLEMLHLFVLLHVRFAVPPWDLKKCSLKISFQRAYLKKIIKRTKDKKASTKESHPEVKYLFRIKSNKWASEVTFQSRVFRSYACQIVVTLEITLNFIYNPQKDHTENTWICQTSSEQIFLCV